MPQRPSRSVKLPANARGRDVYSQQNERFIQQDTARLVQLSAVLSGNRCGSKAFRSPLPSLQLRDAAETACRLVARQNAAAADFILFRRHLWAEHSSILAVLHLHTHSACVLSDPNLQLSAEDLLHYTRLHNHTAMLITVLLEIYMSDITGLEATVVQVATLAVCLGLPAACSRLLATCTSQQRPKSMDLTRMALSVVALVQGLLIILQNLWMAERDRAMDRCVSSGFGSSAPHAPPTGQLRIAVRLLTALTGSHVLEYCVRAVLFGVEVAPARAAIRDGTGAKQSLGFLFGVFLTKLGRAIEDVIFWSLEELSSSDEEVRRMAALTLACSRKILTGPNLQYGMAAHVTAQLVAAEGVGLYGMDEHVAKVLVSAGHGVISMRRPQPVVLDWCGLYSTLTMWVMCLAHFPNSVRLRPCSIRAVHELSLRLLRTLRRCIEEHAARHVCVGLSSNGASSSSGWSLSPRPAHPRLRAMFPKDDTMLLIAEALKCLAMTCRQPPVLFREQQLPLQGPAHEPSSVEYWTEAVPAAHGILDFIEQGGEVGEGVAEIVMRALLPVVPDWPADVLPSAPAPNLAAAMAAGVLPALERVLRVLSQHARASPMDLIQTFRANSRLNWLLAFGNPLGTQALMTTGAKLLQRCLVGTCVHATSPMGADFPAEMVQVLLDMPPLHIHRCLFSMVSELQRIVAKAGCKPSEGTEPSKTGGESPPDASLSTCPRSEDSETCSSHGGAAVLCVDLTCGTADECEGAPHSTKEGSRPAGAGGGGSGAGSSSGPGRRLLGLIARILPRWLVTIGGVALHREYDSGPAVRPLRLLSSVIVMQWFPVLVATQSIASGRLPLPPWWPILQGAVGGCIDLATAAAGWRDVLLQHLDAVALLGRTLRLLLPQGTCTKDLDSDGWSHLVCAIHALDALAAEFPGPVAAGLRDDTLPRLTGNSIVIENRGSESASSGEESGEPGEPTNQEKPNMFATWTRLLKLLERLENSSVEEIPNDCAPLVDPQDDEEGASRDLAALLLAAAAMPLVDNGEPAAAAETLRTCASPFCDHLTCASEWDVKLKACGRCGQAWYCRSECQKAHWVTGHKEQCVRRGSGGG